MSEDPAVGSDVLRWAKAEAARWLDVQEFRERRWRHVQAVGAKAGVPGGGFLTVGAIALASAAMHLSLSHRIYNVGSFLASAIHVQSSSAINW